MQPGGTKYSLIPEEEEEEVAAAACEREKKTNVADDRSKKRKKVRGACCRPENLSQRSCSVIFFFLALCGNFYRNPFIFP